LAHRGATGLLFPPTEAYTLPSLWDRCLPAVVSGAACSTTPPGFTPLAVKLKDLMTPSAVSAATSPGDHRTWPAVWATDSLARAVTSQAYPSNLKQGRVKTSTHGDDD